VTAVGELLTPTATVAGAWPANTPEWYAVRRTGIGSSDVPAILGYSRYKSAAHVWAEKRGELGPEDGSEAAAWGHLLEDVVAREWANRHGVMLATPPTLRHHVHAHWLANPDRLVVGCPDDPDGAGCVLEVKTRSAYVAGSWREDVPDDVLAQTQWQLLVTGLSHAHVACLVGGQRLVEHTVVAEPPVAAYVADQADAVWAAVQDGVRPQVDDAALLLDLLDRLYPKREGVLEVDAAVVEGLRARYKAAAAAEKAAKEEKTAAKAAVALLLGEHCELAVAGATVATFKPDLRSAVDLARLRRDHPAAYADCVSPSPTTPILRWKKDI
jgi:putative phage-type endonuclease